MRQVLRKAQIEKGLVVNATRDRLLGCQSAVLTDYRGLTVKDMDLLRSRCRESGVEYRVVKNSLTWLAVKDSDLEELHPYLVGPTAIGMGISDPIAAAKVLVEFAKEHDTLKIKAGVLEGKVFGPERVKELAGLPSKEVLIAQVLASVKSPVAGLVNTLSAPLRGFINVLKAIGEQRTEDR